MRGVFRSQSAQRWQERGTNSTEPDKTNASHTPSVYQFWTKRSWQHSYKHGGFAAEVDQHPALNCSAYHGQMKTWLMNRK
jgi:hypothetical protein